MLKILSGVAATALLSTLLGAAGIQSAAAFEIAAASYGASTAPWPYVVAFEGGFFKREGVDVTGIRAGKGGTDNVRALLAGGLPYVTSPLLPVLTAAKQGAKLKIISDNVHTSNTFKWVVMPDSPINSIADLKGKRISFTSPKSTSELLNILLLQKAGLKRDDATLIAAGTYGGALTLLENGGVDVAAISEPTYTMVGAKYKKIASALDLLPPLNSNTSITTEEMAKAHGDDIRKILAAIRKAVDYMKTNPKESAALIDKVYKIGPDVIEKIIVELVNHEGIPYWGHGEFLPEDFDNLINGSKLVGAVNEADIVPWRTLVDQSFLAEDLRRDIK